MRYLKAAFYLTLALVDRVWLVLAWPLCLVGIYEPATTAALWVAHRDEQVGEAWRGEI